MKNEEIIDILKNAQKIKEEEETTISELDKLDEQGKTIRYSLQAVSVLLLAGKEVDDELVGDLLADNTFAEKYKKLKEYSIQKRTVETSIKEIKRKVRKIKDAERKQLERIEELKQAQKREIEELDKQKGKRITEIKSNDISKKKINILFPKYGLIAFCLIVLILLFTIDSWIEGNTSLLIILLVCMSLSIVGTVVEFVFNKFKYTGLLKSQEELLSLIEEEYEDKKREIEQDYFVAIDALKEIK